MSETHPTIYLLHGDDEYAIAQAVDELEHKLGEPATASLNTSRLDGNSYNLDQLPSVANALPFLATRRLVILTHPLARLSDSKAQEAQKTKEAQKAKETQEKFKEMLEKVPPTTALVLVEYHLLTSEANRKKNKFHWLEKWAIEHPDTVFLKAYPAPKGAEMARRIQATARKGGGQITPAGAELLASLVDNDPRLADQEIEKLLAFVNYSRLVDFDDVQAITADTGEGDIFTLVDALGSQDGRKAMGMLQRLLEYQDYYAIFGMVVRQYRLLIQTRELFEQGKQLGEIQRALNQHPYVAEKLLGQARRFALPELERVYRRLLETDEAVKTSLMPERLALETFVSGVTTPLPPRSSH
jgi:DNA polymerase-3 subunit delta